MLGRRKKSFLDEIYTGRGEGRRDETKIQLKRKELTNIGLNG